MSRDHADADPWCKSGKRTFSTRARAKRWLKRSRAHVHHGEARTAYKCTECGQFHITSQTAAEREQIREWRATRRTP